MSGILTLLVGALGGGVPTANLTAFLDVNNPSSFPGFGNMWYNIAPNGRSGTTFTYQTGGGTASNYKLDTTNGGIFILNDSGIFPETSSSLFADNTGNFTIEIWTRWGAVGRNAAGGVPQRLALIGETFGNPDQIGYELTFVKPDNTLGNNLFLASYNGVPNYTDTTPTQYRPYPAQWYHIVGTQQRIDSSTWRQTLYINGNAVGTADFGNWDDSNLAWKINQALTNDDGGNTGNIAVSIVRTYNTAFSPSEVIYNYNSDVRRFTGGSYYFNTNGANLQVPGSSNYFVGSNNYTVEWFANYQPIDGNQRQFYSCGEAVAVPLAPDKPGIFTSIQTTAVPGEGRIRHQADGGRLVLDYTAPNVTGNWTHFVVQRSGTNTTLFINGTSVQSNLADTSSVGNNSAPFRIGINAEQDNDKNFKGYITNLRFTNGTALYTDTNPVQLTPYNSDNIANCRLSFLATDSVSWLVDSSPRATTLTATSSGVTWSNNTPFTTSANLVRFNYTGGIQTWTAPSDVTSIDVAVIGAAGSYPSNQTSPSNPGAGAAIAANIPVTPGQTYYLMVGGQALRSRIPAYGNGGFGGVSTTNNGGAGGGMSGIFSSSVTDQANAIIIAGGGGGSGGRSASPGGAASGSNAAFSYYGASSENLRSLSVRGGETRSDLYGFNGGLGAINEFPINNATLNLGNSTITFTYANSTSSNSPVFSEGALTSRRFTISNGTSTGTTYTINCQGVGSSNNFTFVPGQVVSISGANNANYNGLWTVSSASANSFTFIGNVADGGSANASGNAFCQFAPAIIRVSGANNANYNGLWNVTTLQGGTSGSQCTVFNINNTNFGPWTGGNAVISAGGKYGNVYDFMDVFPTPGIAMKGGDAGTTGGGYGGGGGGGGYWGGGPGASGGDASGGGGGGASYINTNIVSNVYYVGTNDFYGNLTVNSGNGLIMISY